MSARLLMGACASLACAIPAEAKPDQAELRTQLLKVYGDWSKAMMEGDAELWKASTTQSRKIGIRNMVVSEKKTWPDAIFAAPVTPPDVSKMVMARTMVKGVTAQLIYFGKADFGVEEGVEIPDGLLVLMFVLERDGWKFNTSRFLSLAGADEVIAQAAKGDFAFLDGPEFEPPGSAPPLPKLCPVPELVGYVEIVSIGYETKVDIAGRSVHTVVDNVQRALIIGGLKNGINPINIEARPLPLPKPGPDATGKPPERVLEIGIYRKTDNPDEPLKRIYHSGENTKPGRFKVIVRGDAL